MFCPTVKDDYIFVLKKKLNLGFVTKISGTDKCPSSTRVARIKPLVSDTRVACSRHPRNKIKVVTVSREVSCDTWCLLRRAFLFVTHARRNLNLNVKQRSKIPGFLLCFYLLDKDRPSWAKQVLKRLVPLALSIDDSPKELESTLLDLVL